MKFIEIKDKIQNLGEFKSLAEIKAAGLRVVRNTKTGDYWLIEEEFLKPAIKNSNEVSTLKVKRKEIKYKLILCNQRKDDFKDSKISEYINWGEQINYHKRVSMLGRKGWWDLGNRTPAKFNFNYLINDVGTTYIGEFFVSDNFHEIHTKKDLGTFLNSAVFWLFQNLGGRASFGGGLLKIQTYELEKMLVLNELLAWPSINKKTQNIFKECGIDPSRPIHSQEPKPLPDRKALDDIVFDALELTEEERKEVYWAVCELVKNRLEKAKSV